MIKRFHVLYVGQVELENIGSHGTPAGRRGTVEEIAAAACYLADEAAAYVTGHTLVIDGGWTAR